MNLLGLFLFLFFFDKPTRKKLIYEMFYESSPTLTGFTCLFSMPFPTLAQIPPGLTLTFTHGNGGGDVNNACSCVPTVALELMDQGVSMWQPTPRKSSCSSCSQNGSSDGSLPNGCNQERQVLTKSIF